MLKSPIIAQGAEAIIIHEGKNIIKERISKKYRHPELDKKIIRQRTKSEAKILEKVSKLIPCPAPENLAEIEKSSPKNPISKIKMPYIEGKKLSENLEQLDWKEICKMIGNQIAKIHDGNIIHGDLTTSNMIWQEGIKKETNLHSNKTEVREAKTEQLNKSHKDSLNINKFKKEVGELVQPTSSEPKLYIIDFGLGYHSERIEDRAVDLHLIKQALEAKHFSIYKEAEKIILENYNSKDRAKVLEQLKKVESRGRYKNSH